MIIGGKVDSGELRKNKPVAIWRKNTDTETTTNPTVVAEGADEIVEENPGWREVGRGEIVDLQQSKIDTKEVTKGNEFGMKIKTSVKLLEGDMIESFEETLKQKTL